MGQDYGQPVPGTDEVCLAADCADDRNLEAKLTVGVMREPRHQVSLFNFNDVTIQEVSLIEVTAKIVAPYPVRSIETVVKVCPDVHSRTDDTCIPQLAH